MGNGLCGHDANFTDHSIFDYRYGEDKMDQKIIHNDKIECSLDSIKPSLVDCETKLKRSEKRFKDITINTDPVVLICGDKQVRCTFQRPEAFLKRQGVLITNKIYKILDKANSKPSNVFIGDQVLQYFGVFLCYLASNPELIDRIILTLPNSYGLCAVQMIIEGKKQIVFIDDYILCQDGNPLFSKPIKYIDMWPCLLQKAWFKVKSCLKNKIQKINPIEVFETFLSYPIKQVQLTESFEQNREIVRKELKNAHLIDANFGCIVTSKLRPNHKIGLTGRKHFYFIKVIQYQNKIYFYLRNPCGVFDFRGSLLEIPSYLQDQILKVTGEPIANGNFLLTEQQFDQQIQSFFLIFYSPSSPFITQDQINFTSHEKQEVFLKFQLKKSGSVGLRLQQLNKGGVYTPITYQLIDVERKALISGQANEFGCFGVAETNLLNNLHQVLMPGNYILRIKRKPTAQTLNLRKSKQGVSGQSRDRLILSANQDVTFQLSATGQVKKEFEGALKEIAKKELALNKNAVRDQIEQIVVWMGDLVLVYANKLNVGKSAINLEVYFPDLKNLECLSHSISKGYTSLPPFPKDQLIIFEKISLTEETLLGKYSLTPY